MEAANGYFEHDADMGIIGGGAALEEAFVSAVGARTFFSETRIETLFDVSHNTCKPEWHEFWGKRRLLYVRRIIRTKSIRGAAEEAPGACKDVDAVAEATERAGLARRVALFAPRICVKG